jgi:hypothetical protein
VDNTVLLVNEAKFVGAEAVKAMLCKLHSSEIWRYVDSELITDVSKGITAGN